MSTTVIIDSGDSSLPSSLDPRHFDPTWRKIWAATNSRTNPSDNISSDTPAKKAIAIAAYTQEMSLAGLLLSQSLGRQIDPSIIDNSRKSLESIYAQAGVPEPQAARHTLETQLSERLADSKDHAVQSGIN